jgi:alpha-tubulin suppressor-like RCC1 family protein
MTWNPLRICPLILMLWTTGLFGVSEERLAPGFATAVAAGGQRSFKLSSNGALWAWGGNGNGALGDGTAIARPAPVQINSLSGVVRVSAGALHTLALKGDGTLWAWGWNGFGQLGDRTLTDRSLPVPVTGLSGVVAVSTGVNHCLALRDDGTVWAWGWNINGQVSNESTTQWITEPMKVRGLSGVVALAGGYNYSLALKNDGTVWRWGRGNAAPVPVSGLSGVVAIAGGYQHSLALKGDGSVWAWGTNTEGQLGDGTTLQRDTPAPVSGLANVVALAASSIHSVALKDDGTVWAWGWNASGQLGDGTTTARRTPVKVSGLKFVVAVAAAPDHSVAVKSDGVVVAWGSNYSGQMGNGTMGYYENPVQVTAISNVAELAAGGAHSLVVKNGGTVWAWGKNTAGQLGDSTVTSRITPVQVVNITDAWKVAAGRQHSLVKKFDGTVWAWGENAEGQLGNGTTTLRTVPAPVSGMNQVAAIAAGGDHSLAVKNDFTVWAWGRNSLGQLGDGTVSQRRLPVQVSGLSGAIGVAAGESHSLAMKLDGTVWAWGSNDRGQLGDGTTTQRSTAVQVSGLSRIVALAAGRSHSLALKSDGTVWAWGANEAGQLGAGDTMDRFLPGQVLGLGSTTAIAAGASHSLAVMFNGSVRNWGAIGVFPPGTPVPLDGIAQATSVAASSHSLALKSDGTLWVWGVDDYGQLGIGAIAYATVPAPTLPTVPPGTPIFSLNRWKLNFGAKTNPNPIVPPAQEVVLTQTGSAAVGWSVVTYQPWIQVSPAQGTGSATLKVSIRADAIPTSGTFNGMVTIMPNHAEAPLLFLPVALQAVAIGAAPYGSFDTPTDNAAGISGSIAVTGWALDDIGVKQVTIWRDPVGPEPVHPNGHVYIGEASFVPGARPDVETRFPAVPNSMRAGWGYLLLTNALPNKGNGTFKLHAYAVDEEGNQSRLGTKTIVVDNAHSVKPFGAIDWPTPGATIYGSNLVSGWALTPQPASIALDGSTIWVNVDGVNIGHPGFGSLRPDVATVFPGYANSFTSGGQFVLESFKYSNGMHTIAWIVHDNQGRADGIGSRYFDILNLGTAPASTQLQPRQLSGYRTDRHSSASSRTLKSGGDGLYEPIEIEELGRLELPLPAAPEGTTWTGGLRAGEELRPLPIGSTLDAENGIFYWQLGPAFLGEFQLEFAQPGAAVVPVTVRIVPKGTLRQ